MLRDRLVVVFTLWLTVACDRGPATEPKPSAAGGSASPQLETPTTAPALASASAVPSAAPSADPAAATGGDPILFALEKNGAKSFVFGTMHVGTDVEKDLAPVVLETFDGASKAAFEVDLGGVDMMEAASAMMLAEGDSAEKHLTQQQWKTLVAEVSSFLMPASALARLKPWALSSVLVQRFLPKTKPMDLVLLERARAQKKELLFLETAREQMAILDKAFDFSMLAEMLDDVPKAKKETVALAEGYRSGDLPAFEKLAFDPEQVKKHPAMFELGLYARNDAWIPKLASPFERGGIFVAVGAAHVLGDRGIVKLLEKQGFTSSRVERAP